MGVTLKIGDDLAARDLRRAERRKQDGRAAERMYANTNPLEGASRENEARLLVGDDNTDTDTRLFPKVQQASRSGVADDLESFSFPEAETVNHHGPS